MWSIPTAALSEKKWLYIRPDGKCVREANADKIDHVAKEMKYTPTLTYRGSVAKGFIALFSGYSHKM